MNDVCRVLHPREIFYTFSQGSSKSRIDMIYVSSQSEIMKYWQIESGFSDHEMICVDLRMKSDLERGPGVWKNNVKYYDTKEFLNKFKFFWDYNFQEGSNKYHKNIIDWWLDFKYNFKMFYIKYCREKIQLSKRNDQILEWGLFNAKSALNINPNCPILIAEYERIKKNLFEGKIKNVKEKIFKNEAQYLMHREKPIKSFFEKVFR